ncbi:MAG TPA: Uma2 family endonuclease [Gemmatimonadaceae bacterium]
MPVFRADRRKWTVDEFYRERDAAPPGVRYELVDGEILVTPSPHWIHQRVGLRLTVLLDAYVRAQAVGELFAAPLDVNLEPALVLQPDILVVPNGELRMHDDIVRHLSLAVEILSPSSARHDRVTKRPKYQRHRVPEYWIVDDRSRTVERWRPDDERPELIDGVIEWLPTGASEAFRLDLSAFFAELAPVDEQI